MAVATKKQKPDTNGSAKPKKNLFDPDEYRMTLGDHLEELRGRLVLALGGYAALLVAAFFFGDKVVSYFCLPLIRALRDNNINTQLVMTEVGEGFSVFIEITMVSAAAVAAPWIAYQFWQFIAAGLYPHERKYVTRYLPLSITLLISGMLFVYFLILPWTLQFLIGFGTDIALPAGIMDVEAAPTAIVKSDAPKVAVYDGNPKEAAEGAIWYDRKMKRMKTFVEGRVRTIQLTSDNLLTPQIKLSTYIDVVETSLVIFGLSFQLPLVVLAVARIGVVPLATLKSIRRYVYFALAVLSAVITPGGDIPSMLGLTAPLIGLYELGIWLARIQPATAGGGWSDDDDDSDGGGSGGTGGGGGTPSDRAGVGADAAATGGRGGWRQAFKFTQTLLLVGIITAIWLLISAGSPTGGALYVVLAKPALRAVAAVGLEPRPAVAVTAVVLQWLLIGLAVDLFRWFTRPKE